MTWATQTFRVPLGLDADNRLVERTQAEKGREYRCPACLGPLIVRAGEVRAPHLAHRADTGCSPEAALHDGAKRLVAQVVNDWLAGRGPGPTIATECRYCHDLVDDPLLARFRAAVIERRLDDGLVADVALVTRGRAIGIVEVGVTHAVDEVKAARPSVPWVELDAETVIARPFNWSPIARSGPEPERPICPACRDRTTEGLRLAYSLGVRVAVPPYLPAPHMCWRCRRPTPVVTWPGHALFGTDPPPEPIPSLLQFRGSSSADARYWANVCVRCGATQCDRPLGSEPDGPFVGLRRDAGP